MRADLSGAPTARELLARVRDGVLEAHAHQDVPFEKLVEELHPERSLRHAPFFQVMFAFQEAGSGRPPTGGLRMEPLEREAETAMFDLTLSVVEDGERLAAVLTYRPDLFDGATVERMLGHYGALLEGMAETPGRPVAETELPGEEERRLLAEWSRSEGEGAGALLLHGAFEARVRSTPDALAAVAGDERLTYAELDRRAERLARLLRARGVGPESRVAACTARDARMPVAAMAILKAGGVYLPLDPAYPAERLAYMLADSGVRLVVSDAETAGVLPDFPGEVLLLGPGGAVEEDGDGAADAPAPEVLPRNAAYLIYTSGSTGRPKGVLVEHGAAAAHFLAFGRMLGLGPEDRVLHFAAAGFDVSLEQIFVTLLAGASMAIRAGEPWSPAEFPERARALGVTVANLPPAYWHEVVERGGGSMPGVRLLLLGGDALPSATVRRALGAPDAPRLVNGYGPTEGVVSATVYEVPRGFPGAFAGPVVPIGRLLPARTAHVLDRAGLPAPLGAAGDLHLGGSLLARGYLGRPELTAERFVPDPFGGVPCARLYRTGDRVRWLADGTLEFLGRTDQQVKIRGFRIEPGEIEAHLLAMDEVREAVVTAREESVGERRLVAYLTAAPGAALPEAAELRGRLRERLPEHMVPSAFVALDALPLTPHGKLDRRALPAPERTEGDGYVAPRSAAEATLAGIWAEVLGLERVGVEDDFFALGGHSLLATRVAARVAEAFGTHLPVRALFEAPTVARLAERVAGADAGSAAPPLLPVEEEDGRRPSTFPLSFAQQRLWFLDQLEPGSAAYNVPVALRLRGPLDVAALERALTEVVHRHEVLRTVFRAADGGAVAEVRPPAPAAIPVTELGHLPEAEREAAVLRRVREEATCPFDLERGP
ncbi:MAG TPA: amino acid adenylation domain-containing protein, partial [Longimicrobiaceae bacterium]